MRTRLLTALLGVLVTPSLLNAHAIHTTMTIVTTSTGAVTINIRTFADDFSTVVARQAGKPAPADSSAPLPDVQRYVSTHFSIRDGAGKPVTLESCGVRRAGELYWLCFRGALPSNAVRGAKLHNQMLTELHADQVNIVQVDGRGARRTVLFTKTSTPALLDAKG
ncbi:MAG TPA: DUF6702 family protein [Gemmatimonadaceae bacterium]|nr:DUF6702 family protein [Gemmatimonadaceae bacterium]